MESSALGTSLQFHPFCCYWFLDATCRRPTASTRHLTSPHTFCGPSTPDLSSTQPPNLRRCFDAHAHSLKQAMPLLCAPLMLETNRQRSVRRTEYDAVSLRDFGLPVVLFTVCTHEMPYPHRNVPRRQDAVCPKQGDTVLPVRRSLVLQPGVSVERLEGRSQDGVQPDEVRLGQIFRA